MMGNGNNRCKREGHNEYVFEPKTTDQFSAMTKLYNGLGACALLVALAQLEAGKAATVMVVPSILAFLSAIAFLYLGSMYQLHTLLPMAPEGRLVAGSANETLICKRDSMRRIGFVFLLEAVLYAICERVVRSDISKVHDTWYGLYFFISLIPPLAASVLAVGIMSKAKYRLAPGAGDLGRNFLSWIPPFAIAVLLCGGPLVAICAVPVFFDNTYYANHVGFVLVLVFVAIGLFGIRPLFYMTRLLGDYQETLENENR